MTTTNTNATNTTGTNAAEPNTTGANMTEPTGASGETRASGALSPDARARLDEVRGALAGVGHLVAGDIVPGDGTFTVTAPWLGAPLAECPSAGTRELDAAVAAAKAAQPSWAADEQARVRALHAIADAIEANAELLGTVL
ncbi:MAG: aldehyde dehydrogenase family protein, partial [Pseudoclavibacter sp.]